ncbi:MAG: pyridoxal-phosphate dependent enzyme [Pirellulaceae bacterium]
MTPTELPAPQLADVYAAADRIAAHAHRTPVLTSTSLDELTGARLFFKCECFQKAGAFKFRGACNAVFSLDDETARRGVVTHSSGNHAAALALAARYRGIPAHIVMPENAPRAKRAAVEAYGGRVVPCQATLESRETTMQAVRAATQAVLVHPYDDPLVIAGQGTVALELLDQRPDLHRIVAPVSGGGLLSGMAITTKTLRPDVAVTGAEPEEVDEAARSHVAGQLMPAGTGHTIADGLRATLSQRTLNVLLVHVEEIVTVSESQIVTAMRLLWERLKIVVEPSGAVPFAAVLAHPDRFRSQRVGLVLSGGNLDLDRLPWQ